MKSISTRQMIEMLSASKGATMVGMIAVTDPCNGKPMKFCRQTDAEKAAGTPKNSNPFVDDDGVFHLVKVQRGHAMFNCRYNKAVEKRVAQEINAERALVGESPLEGDALTAAIDERFRKGENWQNAVLRPDGTMTPFAEHKTTGELYLRTMFYNLVGDCVYIDRRDGRIFKREDVADVLPVKSENKNQGLEKENVVRYNVWKMEGVRALKMDGELYRVRPYGESEAEIVFEELNKRLADMDPPSPPDIAE